MKNARSGEDSSHILVDPIAVPDTFVSGLGNIEDLGCGCFRFTFFANQKSLIDGRCERVVVARLIGPASTARACSETALELLAGYRKEESEPTAPHGVQTH